jgi:CheY-like chemotaxis protein
MRVLVVEDNKKTASFIRKALLAEGFAVDLAEDGETALSTAISVPFDAIVLDIMLPGRDGLSVLCMLHERRVATPVLLLSARNDVNEWIEGLDLGADDYLPKPFVPAEVVDAFLPNYLHERVFLAAARNFFKIRLANNFALPIRKENSAWVCAKSEKRALSMQKNKLLAYVWPTTARAAEGRHQGVPKT